MTDDRRASLIERMADAIDKLPPATPVPGSPYDSLVRGIASAALDIALDEAAKVVTEHYEELCAEHRLLLMNRAAAIRALKSTA